VDRIVALLLVPPFLAASAATAYVVAAHELYRWVRE
jgi:hypothetical protein